MIRDIITIFILTILVLVNADCLDKSAYCVGENQPCGMGNSTCSAGLYCLENPSYPSVEAALGTTSSEFEPIPQYICLKQVDVGSPCSTQDQCKPGLFCYVPEDEEDPIGTCQELVYAFYGEECRSDFDCFPSLFCDPYKRVCLAKLSEDDILSGYQCLFFLHCPFNQLCNETSHRCVDSVKLGGVCDDSVSTLQCGNNLACYNNGSISTCIEMFVVKEGGACDVDLDNFSGERGYYWSMCQPGLFCDGVSGNCTKPPTTSTPSSVNCTQPSDCSEIEDCICNNSTNTGLCSPIFNTQPTVMEQCAKLSKEYIQCQSDNQCYPFSATGYFTSKTCVFKHCRSLLCQIQSLCTYTPPNVVTCGINVEPYGTCALNNASSSIQFTLLLLFILIITTLFF